MYEIKIHVTREADLYNAFDQDNQTISGDLQDFLFDRLSERAIVEKIQFVFSSPEEINKEQLCLAIDRSFLHQKDKLRKRHNQSRFQSIRLLIIGIIFVVLGIVLGTTVNAIIATIISTIGSFSIWEAANRWLIELPHIKVNERLVSYLSDYEITVVKESSQ